VPRTYATRVAHLPPVGSLFAAFLGYNPIGTLLHPLLGQMPHAKVAYLTGQRFFPTLVARPFASGIHEAFYFAAACCVVAAIASWLRGAKYIHSTEPAVPATDSSAPAPTAVPERAHAA
jgi:hypothetical protein